MWLRTSAGAHVQVTSIHYRTALMQCVHNLTIADFHTYYVEAGDTPVLVHNAPCIHASVAYQDWGNKGAHIHIGNNEVRIFPNGQGGIGAEGIRLRHGTASAKEVQRVLDEIHSNADLRADIISKAKAVRAAMNANEYGMSSNRAAEMHFLIKELEKIG